MRPLALLALALALVLPACTSVRPLDTQPEALPALNARLASQRVAVHLRSGEHTPAVGVRFAPDSTSWVDPATGTLRVVSTADVARVETLSRRRGAVRGLAVGAATGAALGLVGGVIGTRGARAPFSEGPEDDAAFQAFLTAGIAGAGALVGGVPGTLFGALVGDRTVYAPGAAGSVPVASSSAAPAAQAHVVERERRK